MRIACITSSWPTADNPSAGAFVREHTEVLRRAGHEVSVFTWRAGDFADGTVSVAPLGRHSLFSASGAPDELERAPWRVAEAPLAAAAMLRELRNHEVFDLYLGHWFVPGGLVARAAGDLFGRPSAVVGHSGGIHALLRLHRLVRARLLRTIARPTTTTVPSKALAELVGQQVDVLPMGYHPSGVASRGDAVICYGRLVELKGFDLALRAAAVLDVEVHVVGSGPELESLKQIAPHAKFWGWADSDLKREVFPRCGRAMFPSRTREHGRHEGWPVSVLELSSTGIVPFVADWPGSRELVVAPAVQVVRDGDWRRAIEMDAAPLRERTTAHAELFSWSALERRWVDWVERAGSRDR